MANEEEKEAAGRAAAKLVRDGDIVGLGTGSTAYFTVVALGESVKAGLKIIGIPTSVHTADLARAVGIPLTTLDEHPEIDITIDGADEVDPKLNLIKGGGGALTREKVVASASKKMVVVADSGKVVAVLMKPDGSPFLTDNGNQILDCSFGKIDDPPELARELSGTPGVVEHGLFIGLAKLVVVGRGASVEEIRIKLARKRVQTKRLRTKRPSRKRKTSRKT